MFPPDSAIPGTSFVRQGVFVDVVWVGGTRVYYPIVVDWIEEEVRARRRGGARSRVQCDQAEPPDR
jgi:hypothetical protein